MKSINTNKLSDLELIQKYKNGDKDAIGILYKKYMHLIYGSCLKYLKNEERIDMLDFIMKLSKKKLKVIVYPIYENWHDLGQKEENNK